MSMEEIQGINHQVMIASMGRGGVRKGGTKECAVATLAETEAWPITKEHFGFWYETALNAKAKAVEAIKKIVESFDKA